MRREPRKILSLGLGLLLMLCWGKPLHSANIAAFNANKLEAPDRASSADFPRPYDASPLPEPYDLSSPYATLRTHLYALNQENASETASMVFDREGISPDEAYALAARLKSIFNHKGIYINLDKVPKDPDYKDPISQTHRYQVTPLLPQIYLVKVGNDWVYSYETIANIDHLYRGIARFRLDKLSEFFPCSWQRSFLGLLLWQYASIVLVIAALLLIYKFITTSGQMSIRLFLMRRGYTLALQRHLRHGQAMSKALGIAFICLLILHVAIPVIQLSISITRYMVPLFKGIEVISLTAFVYQIVDGIAFLLTRGIAEKRIDFNADLIPLLRKFAKVLVVVIGFITFISLHPKVTVSALLTSISVGGFGLALASQDTIKNLFGSLMIFLDEPFGVGDLIKAGEVVGRIEEIGLRSTRIKTNQHTIVYVPNSILANTYIRNYGPNTHRYFYNRIILATDTPIEKIDKFVKKFNEIAHSHPAIIKNQSYANLTDIQQIGVEVTYALYFKNATPKTELAYRQEILTKVLQQAEAMEISLKIPKD